MRDHVKHEMADDRIDPKENTRVRPRRPHWRFEDANGGQPFSRSRMSTSVAAVSDCRICPSALYEYRTNFRRSETAATERLGLLESAEVDELLWDCDEESRKITSSSRTL